MTAIWFILAFMTGAAVLALLRPMSRRAQSPEGTAPADLATETGFYEDQLREIERDLGRGLIAPAEAEAARTEAARRLLRANREGYASGTAVGRAEGTAEPALRQRRAASAFALSTIPLVALLAYGLYGSPDLPSQTAADRQAAQSGGQDLMKVIGQIEARLAGNPTDARGWAVLAPVYMRMGRFDDAAHAYEAVARLEGESAQRLSDWGEALVAAGNGTVSPQSRGIFERAVALDRKFPKPAFYLARADEQAGNVPGAIGRLDTLVATAAADAPWLPLVRETLARLKGGSAPAAKPEPDAPAADPAPGPRVSSAAERDAPIRAMVEGLDQRLGRQGGTADEWLRLVRSYGVLGEREKALAALQRGRTALGGDATGLARLDAQAQELGLSAQGAASPAPAAGGQPAAAAPEVQAGLDTEAALAAVKAMPTADRNVAIRGMVAALDQRLAARGGTADEWMRLVRSYSVLGERAQAIQALDRARMALATDTSARARLDALGTELDLRAEAKP